MAEGVNSGITHEQLQIIELVAKGWTDQRIADHLGISLSTEQRRLRAAAETLNARSRVGVAMEAVSRKLIEPQRESAQDAEEPGEGQEASQ